MSTHLFQKISSMFGNPTLDLFASRINYQIDRYISWKLDPKALTIDAFSIKWNTDLYYIFPLFSSLGKVTAKIYRDKTKAVLVIPKWPTQYWHPNLLRKATRSMAVKLLAKICYNPRIYKKFTHYTKSFTHKTPDRLTTQDMHHCVSHHVGKNIVQRKT